MKAGKCKRCGEKWDSKHRCAKRKETKNLYECEATNDSNSDESYIEEIKDSPQFSLELDNENILQVSLSTMTSISQGHIKKSNVMVMIDTGSTHNFLNSTMEKRLNIFTFPMPNLKVMLVDGKKIEKVGKCHKLKL